jgi:hypothetical protein
VGRGLACFKSGQNRDTLCPAAFTVGFDRRPDEAPIAEIPLGLGDAGLTRVLTMSNSQRPSSSFGRTEAPDKGQVPTERGASSWAVSGLLVLVTLVACVALLEVGLRAIGRYRTDGLDGFHAPRGVSYGLKPNVSKRIFWPTVNFTVRTSDQGFRAKETGPVRLGDRPYYAILGSSEVFGNGLDYEQTFVGILAAQLEKDGIDVVNLAVDGHHLLEQESIFREYVRTAKQPPARVVICLNPLLIGGYDDVHKDAVVRRGELFPKDHWRLPLVKMFLSNCSTTYCFFRDAIRNIQARYFSRKDFALSFYVERYSTTHPIRAAERSEDFLRHLKGLEDYIRSLKAAPVCAYFPTVGGFLLNDLKAKGKLAPGLFDTAFFVELSRAHCQAEGIQFINAEPLLQSLYDKGEKLNFDADAHFNGPTSRALGEFLYRSLQSAPKAGQK